MSLSPIDVGIDGFKKVLGSTAASVNVITMRDPEGRAVGMTATAFSSVSADPLLVLVCINRATRTYEYARASGTFGVNILGTPGQRLSDYCSRPGGDKHLEQTWLTPHPEWLSPALRGALAFLDCEIDQDIQAGTHAVLIGRVRGIGIDHAHDGPLLHFRGAYRQLQTTFARPRPLPLPITSLEEFA